MILQKQVRKEDFYRECLSIMNTVFNLTNTEIKILSEFLNLKTSFNLFEENESNKLTFSSTSRELVCSKLGISKYNLNNYINGLKKKRMIIELGSGEYKLNPYLEFNNDKDFEITFKIKI